MFNFFDRRQLIHFDERRNRKRTATIIEAPVIRNHKLIALRSRQLDEFIICIVVFMIMIALGLAICVHAAYMIAPQTPDALLECLVGALGMLFIGIGLRFLRKASKAWNTCDEYEERLERQRQLLSQVLQPQNRKLPIVSHDWMQ